MFLPNCHCSRPRLPRPNRFGSSSPRKPPTPVPCPRDAPKLMLPVRRSSTRNTTSTSTPLAAGSPGASGLLRHHLGVDVAVVGVEVLHLLGGGIPFGLIERPPGPGRHP